LPATKVGKKMMHQSTSTVGDKEVDGRRRRQWINRGGGPGRREGVAQGKAEVAMQQPVMADNKRHWQDDRQKCWQRGDG
jgi:hypothetical protein